MTSQKPKEKHDETTNKDTNRFGSVFMTHFENFWTDFDHEYDEMDKRIKERKKLNGRATHHEIDL